MFLNIFFLYPTMHRGPFLNYSVKRYFAIFLNECSPHTGGDRGKAECGASAEGWRERPALALFLFSIGTRSARRSCFSDSGPPSSPQPSGPCRSPAQAGLLFSCRRHPASLCWPSHSEYPVQATKTVLGRSWRHPHPPRPPVRQGEKPNVEASTIVNPRHVRLLGVIFWHIA